MSWDRAKAIEHLPKVLSDLSDARHAYHEVIIQIEGARVANYETYLNAEMSVAEMDRRVSVVESRFTADKLRRRAEMDAQADLRDFLLAIISNE